MISKADVHDLTAAKQMTAEVDFLSSGKLLGDKAYIDAEWFQFLREEYGVEIITPRKKKPGDTMLGDDVHATFVSSARQPIESFFNCLNKVTKIQEASTVRSAQGLLLHIFGRLACALFLFAMRYLNP